MHGRNEGTNALQPILGPRDREAAQALEVYRGSDWFDETNGEGFKVRKGGGGCDTSRVDWSVHSEVS